MLPDRSLNDVDFETIRKHAVRSIAAYQSEWTNYNTADTGMTLLELLAWMQEMQIFYLEHSNVENLPLYLELLGITPRGLEASSVIVEIPVKHPVQINKNTVFVTDGISFEPKEQCVIGGEQLHYLGSFDKNGNCLWESRGKVDISHGEWMFGEQPEAGSGLYMGFDQPFSPRCRHAIYVQIEERKGEERNSIPKGRKNLFSHYRLEYRCGSKWKQAKILSDETAGFLKSGFIEWSAEGEAFREESLYFLRFRLIVCDFDVPPRFTVINTHSLRLCQKETIAASEQLLLPYEDNGRYQIPIQDYFDEPEQLELFVKFEESYINVEYQLSEKGQMEFQYFGKHDAFLTVLFVAGKVSTGKKVKLEGTGFPNQVIELENDNTIGQELRILVETGKNTGIYRFWSQVEHFWNAEPDTEVYRFQEETGQILFGDGIHGAVPKGNIFLTDCIHTLGEKGRIQKGKEFHWRQGTAYNPVPAEGGSPSESVGECWSRFRRQLQEPKRAVTEEDFERLVKQTPGLIIKRVKAISDKKQENQITLIVEGGGQGGQGKLNPVYQKEIEAWMEDKRLLGTCLHFETPVYIPIVVRMEVEIYEQYHQARQWMIETVTSFFEMEMKDFGSRMNYSHLYGRIDRLSCVAEIKGLEVLPSGKGIAYEREGSFRLPERGLAVLEDIQIEVIKKINE